MADVLYFNGRFTTTDERVLGVEDRGFQFGDAIYEVFKFVGTRPVFLHEHFERMQRGLQEIEIRSPWQEEQFLSVMHELIARTSFADGIVYIQISRGEGKRAHFYPEDLAPTVVAYSRAFSFPDAAKKELGISLITAGDLRWKHCNIKSVNLLPNALAKKKAQRAGADEVLLIDDGVVREAASSSFFGIRGSTVITHPLDDHILPGVVRDRVVRLALAAKIRVDERPLREQELFDLGEAFITNTTMGVMPVSSIDGRRLLRGGITTSLQQMLDRDELRDATAV
jgi:D-alanine transaminase